MATPTIKVTPQGELHYIVKIDNTGGAAFQYDLLSIPNATPNTAPSEVVFGSPTSKETNALTRWFGDVASRVTKALDNTGDQTTARAFLSVMPLSAELPSSQLQVDGSANPDGTFTVRFYVNIPADKLVSFVWGMTHSIEGGFALPGGFGTGGGGGGGGGLIWNEEVHIPAVTTADVTYYQASISSFLTAASIAPGDTITIGISDFPVSDPPVFTNTTFTAVAAAPDPNEFLVDVGDNNVTLDNLFALTDPFFAAAGLSVYVSGAGIRTYRTDPPENGGRAVTLSSNNYAAFSLLVQKLPYYKATKEEAGFTPISTGEATQDFIIRPRGIGALVKEPAVQASLLTLGIRGPRGLYAVDLGSSIDPEDVASGIYSVVSGGEGNRATAFHSVVAGGQLNKATGNGSAVAGGGLNEATGDESFAMGNYNLADGDNSVALGVHATTRGISGIQTVGFSAPYILTNQQLSRGDRQSSRIVLSGDLYLTADPHVPELDYCSYLTSNLLGPFLNTIDGRCNIPRIPYRAAANGILEYAATFAVKATLTVIDVNDETAVWELKGLARSRFGPVYEFVFNSPTPSGPTTPAVGPDTCTAGAIGWRANFQIGYTTMLTSIPDGITIFVDVTSTSATAKAVATVEMTEVMILKP